MNRALSPIIAIASLILLAGCTISVDGGDPFDPDATRVTARAPSADPPPVGTGTLEPGEQVFFRVSVPSSVASASEAIYYDLDVSQDQSQTGANAIAMRLYSASGNVLASSLTYEGFTRGTLAETTAIDPARALQPQQGITPDWFCFGPCIIEPSGTGTRYVRLENITAVARDYDFYAYGQQLQDDNEPNDSSAQAVPFSGVEGGALEFLGDDDYFEVVGNGQLFFDSTAAAELELRARVIGSFSSTTLPPGGETTVSDGDIVQVFSRSDWAGSPRASGYSLEIR